MPDRSADSHSIPLRFNVRITRRCLRVCHRAEAASSRRVPSAAREAAGSRAGAGSVLFATPAVRRSVLTGLSFNVTSARRAESRCTRNVTSRSTRAATPNGNDARETVRIEREGLDQTWDPPGARVQRQDRGAKIASNPYHRVPARTLRRTGLTRPDGGTSSRTDTLTPHRAAESAPDPGVGDT